jgi:hypothetical protein
MAIDTAEKRASVQGNCGDSQMVGRLDGVSGINAADRSHITCRYRGIAAASPTGITILDFERAVMRGSNRGIMRGV